jgi:competence protein ComEC
MVFVFFMTEYFHRITPVSILLNLPAGVIAAAVTPLGLMITILPEAASVPAAWLVRKFLALLLWLLDAALGLPAATLRAPSVPLWLWVMYAAAAAILIFAIRRRSRAACITAAGTLGALQIWLSLGDFSPKPPAKATLTFLDVGQGDSTLIELPDGQRVLIDGGGISAGRFLGLRNESTFSIGEDVVSSYLFHRRIRRLDAVVLTHAHFDHLDGLLDIAENFEIGEFWLGRNPMIPAYRDLIEKIQAKQIPLRFVSAGQTLGPFTVLHPPTGWKTRRGARNDDSVVLMLETEGRTALLTGDIESRISAPEKVDVLKVPHHGSRGARLDTRGTIRVVSVGANNPFGHPHPSIPPALRTDRLGAVTVVMARERLAVASALTSFCPSCKLTLLSNSH